MLGHFTQQINLMTISPSTLIVNKSGDLVFIHLEVNTTSRLTIQLGSYVQVITSQLHYFVKFTGNFGEINFIRTCKTTP